MSLSVDTSLFRKIRNLLIVDRSLHVDTYDKKFEENNTFFEKKFLGN